MSRPPVPAPRTRRLMAMGTLPPPPTDGGGIESPPSSSLSPSSSSEVSVTTSSAAEDCSGNSQEFKRLYRLAYSATLSAQNLDAIEGGNKEDAFKGYANALEAIDAAVTLAHKGGFTPIEVDNVDELTLKMRLIRKEILERISDLQGSASTATQEYLQGPSGPSRSAPPEPPAYSETAIEPLMPITLSSYSNLAAVLDEIENEQSTMANPLPLNAREVFSLPDNVQIYFISPQDNVSAPSYPSFLRLVLMEQQEGELGVVTSSVPAFLQVGDWTYPLIPNHSPVFRSTEGIYIFPDLTQTIPGSYVGLILPEGVPIEVRRGFEDTLLQLVGVQQFPDVIQPAVVEEKEKPPRPPPPSTTAIGSTTTSTTPTGERRLSTKIAEGLIGGAEYVSRGLVYGAVKTSSLLDRGAAFLTSKIEPAKEKQVIKPEYKKGMKTAKTVSGKAVQVSGFVVTQVGHATIALGRFLAPHVHKASTKILAKTVATDEVDATNKVDQVLEVTTGAVVGFGTIYLGLENAAKTLVKSLANNTVHIVQHKYGDEAGEFTADTAATAGNAALTALNTKNLAPKSVATKVVKNTGKVIVKQYQEKKGGGISGSDGSDSPAGAGSSSEK